MKATRRAALVASVFVTLGALVGCTAATPNSGSSGSSGMCPDGSIHIGIAKSKTGGFSVFDKVGGNGSLVAINQLNKAGGVAGCKIKVDWKDIKSDPAVGAQVTSELIANGAQIIIAPSDFDLGVPASLVATKAGKFTISPEASSTDWPKAAGSNMFVQAITEKDIGSAQAIFASQKGWNSSFVVINDSFNFFKTTRDVFATQFKGKIDNTVTVADDATDYSAVISKIRAASPQPDFIYLADYYPHVGTFLKQLNAAGVDLPVLGNPTYSSPDLPAAVGNNKTLAKVFYPSQSYYEGAGASSDVAKFTALYKKEFGSFPPNANAAAGYEGVLLLAKAIEKAKSTDAAKLTKAMDSLKNVKLPGSTVYSFTDGHTVRSATIVGFTPEGAFREVEKLNPSKVG